MVWFMLEEASIILRKWKSESIIPRIIIPIRVIEVLAMKTKYKDPSWNAENFILFS